jgi:hypothetical protein
MKTRLLSGICLLTMAAGCTSFEHSSSATSPSPIGTGALMGVWTSSTIIPTPSSCTDFKWTVTEQTATTARGNFTATCANTLKLAGIAQGTLRPSGTIDWSAQGTATAPDLPSCAISLTGTAELGTDTIRIPYSGDTCLGKVSGVESVKRR